MLYPLGICAACIVTSIIGTFFVKLGANDSIMGALYKGLIAAGVLSIGGLAIATHPASAGARSARERRMAITGQNLFYLRRRRPRRHRPDRVDHRILHRHRQAPGGVDRAGVGHRPRHQRHPGPRGVAGIDRAAGDRHRRRHHRDLSARRPVRHRDRGDDDARPRRHHRRARRFRPGHRQCRRHRRNGRPAERSAPLDRRARRGRQHHQGGHQGLCHRLGRPRRAGAVRGLQSTTSTPSSRSSAARPYFKGCRHRLVRPLEPLRRRRPDLRRPDPVPVRRHRDDRGRPRRGFGGRGGAPPVPREARHHGGHRAAGLCPRGRSAHQGGDQGDDHPVAAAGAGADRRLLRRAGDFAARRPTPSRRSAPRCSA